MSVRGDVNGVRSNGEIWGWVLDTDSLEEVLIVRIAVGEHQFDVLADMHRPDLAKGFGGTGNHGFVFAPPASIPPGQYQVEVTSLPEGVVLPRGRFELNVGERDNPIRGRIISFTARRITGWAYDAEDVARSLTLDVFVDHKPALKIPCDMLRKDVEGREGIECRVGFHSALPLEFWDGESHRLTLKESKTGVLVHDGWLRTDKAKIATSSSAIFGELTDIGPLGIAGWVTDGNKPLTVELEVDDILIERTEAAEPIQLDTRRNSGFRFSGLPTEFFDGASHSIAVYVVGQERIQLGVEEVVLQPNDVSKLEGKLFAAQGGKLAGWAIDPQKPDAPVELGLIINGVETQTTLTRPSGDPRGAFEFHLPIPPSEEGWFGAEIKLVSFPRGLTLPFSGRPILDSLEAKLWPSGSNSEVVLSSGAPLPPRLRAELIEDGKPKRVVELKSELGGLSARALLESADTAGLARLTHLRVGSVTIPLKGTGSVSEVVKPVEGTSGRTPGQFVALMESRVRRRLSDLARNNVVAEGDTGRPDYSGVWRFVSPSTVEGWAVDLANPADPLEVELVVDGTSVQRSFASQKVSPREARLSFDLPIGFRFDLSTLNQRKAAASVEARIVGGAALMPGKPQQIDLAATKLKTGSIGSIDMLAAEGRLSEAYLNARFAAIDGTWSHVHRYLALDFALRTSWHDYETFLSERSDKATRGFVAALLEAYKARMIEGSLDEMNIADAGELPAGIYHPILTAAPLPGAPRDAKSVFDAHALWLTLRQLPTKPELHPRYGDIALVVPNGVDASPAARAALEELAALGCIIISAAGQDADALVDQIAKHAKDCNRFVVLRAWRVLPIQALGFWSSLPAEQLPAAARVMRLGDEPISPLTVALLGRSEDDDIVVCTDAASAAQAIRRELPAPGSSSDFIACELVPLEVAYPIPSCVIVHDFAPAATPSAPPGSRIIVIAGEPAEGVDPFSQAWMEIASADLPGETPIIFMSRLYQYPSDYVASCLREFVLNSQRSVITSALSYDPGRGEFALSATATSPTLFLGLRERGCYRLSDMLDSGNRYGPMEDSRVIVGHDRPFRLLPHNEAALSLTNDAEARAQLRQLTNSLMVKEKGFAGSVLTNWFGAADTAETLSLYNGNDELAIVNALSLGADAAKTWMAKSDFHRRLQDFARRGHHDVVAGFLREQIEHPAEILKLKEDDLLGLLDCCKVLGLQQYFNRHMFAYLPNLLNRSPQVIVPLFENMAMSLSVTEITAVLMAGAARILQDRNARSVFRLVSACRRYCSGHAMVLLVGMIRQSPHRDVLKEASVAEAVGSALMAADPLYLELSNQQGDPAGPVFTVPLIERIIAALLGGDAPLFTRLLNVYFSERHSVIQLLQRLRTYTFEITELGIPPGAVRYPPHATIKEALALAILMDDSLAIRRLDGGSLDLLESTDDAHGMVAASYHSNMRPLERAFARWGAEYGVAPVSFAGENIEGLFAHLASLPLPPKAVMDHGRVTIILTVYNPDLPLLVLALESLLRQTYPNIEIILVDDASDQVASHQVEELANVDPRIIFLRMPRNAGPYVGRNRALELASGNFIAIHDGDDYAHPQRIEAQIASLMQSPVLKLSTACHLRIDKLARLQFEHTLEVLGDGTMTSVFRREVFDVIGNFAPVRSRGDVEFRERIKSTYGGHVHHHINCPLTFCYATPASLSNSVNRLLPDYLALFREAFARRVRIPVLNGRRVTEGADDVVIPWPLRSENPLS